MHDVKNNLHVMVMVAVVVYLVENDSVSNTQVEDVSLGTSAKGRMILETIVSLGTLYWQPIVL